MFSNVNNILDNDKAQVCRLCLAKEENLIYIFDPEGYQGFWLSEIIKELLQLEMNMEEVLGFALQQEGSSSSSSSDDDLISSSSESSSSDNMQFSEEEMYEEDILFPLLQMLMNGRRKQRVQNFIQTVQAKSDSEFRDDFRLHRKVAYILIESLEESGLIPTHGFGVVKKSSELGLLMTLWFLANKEPHRTLSNLFDLSISSVSRIVRRVMQWLMTLVPEFITWPEGDDCKRISDRFELMAGIPGCIGAIDGSHINIIQPKDVGREYFNRKQNYSIVLQAVTDCNMRFTNIYCGDPGSYHDVRVLRRSELFRQAEQNLEHIFPNCTFLLGDKGYNGVGKKWIVCPFRDNGNITQEQGEFNRRVSSTRVVVERAFGILKGRFRYLQKMQLQCIPFIVQVVVGCCVLHNICLENGDVGEDFLEQADPRELDDNSSDEADDEVRGVFAKHLDNRRDALFRTMYNA